MDKYNQQVADTRILQKVNAAHRNAFAEKYPGQCEHILRLITERLHLGLDKRDGQDPSDPDTWKLSATEIVALAEAMWYLHQIRDSHRVGQ